MIETSVPAPTVVIRPSRPGLRRTWHEVWRYRDLWWILAARDVRVRYKQTVLGVAWAVLQPLIAMAVFTIVFGKFLGIEDRLPDPRVSYSIWVYAGLLPWTFFAATTGGAATSLVNNSALITKVYFPRVLIPLSVLGYTTVDLCMAGLVLAVMMVVSSLLPGMSFLLVPMAFVGILLCATGCGIALAALTVKYRDFRYAVPFLIQIWLFLTPVIYPTTVVPEKYHWVANLNPLTGLISGFRAGVLNTPIDVLPFVLSLIMAVVIFALGAMYLWRVESYFADIV
jgi:lipopolysaccharide transport system permease protein